MTVSVVTGRGSVRCIGAFGRTLASWVSSLSLPRGRLTFTARGVTSVAPKTRRTAVSVGRRVRVVSIAPGAPGGAPIAKSSFGSSATIPSSTPSPCTSASLLIIMCASELSSSDWPGPVSALISETMATARRASGEV